MTLKNKALAAVTAIAVTGFTILPSAQATLSSDQTKIQALLAPGVVLENPAVGQTYATDAQLVAAIVAVTKVKNAKNKLSATDALNAVLSLVGATNGEPDAENNAFRFSTTAVVQGAAKAFAGNKANIGGAVKGAYLGFVSADVTDTASASADLIASSILGISQSGVTDTKRKKTLTTALTAAVSAAVKATSFAPSGAAAGAAAQYSSLNSLAPFVAVIKAAAKGAPTQYEAIAQAVATAANQIFLPADFTSGNIAALIADAVRDGYVAAQKKAVSKGKSAQILASATVAVSTGVGQTSGAGAAGLANYSFANLSGGPVTDIYGL